MIHVPHILHSYIPYTSDIYTVFVSRLLLKILIEPSRKPSFYFDPTLIWVTPCTEKKKNNTSSVRMGVRCFKTTYPIHIPIPPPPPNFFFFFLLFSPPPLPTKPRSSPKRCGFRSPRPRPALAASEAERGAGSRGPDGPRRLPALHGNPTCAAGK